MEPSRITVSRRVPEDVKQRQLVLSLDGRPWATLMFGEIATMELEPGPHELRIHNTLVWKTVGFDAAPGQHVRYSAANRAGWGTYTMLSLFGVGPLYVSITREPEA
ncbi:MAG TPA: hypothetical protein VFO14_11415 [Vicinamibacterales bacterium]|jgi:hypothetical protein|nr:hypothetical protein [Vicinamibacterales bacterium]